VSPATGVPQQSPSAVTEMTHALTPDAPPSPSPAAPLAPSPGPATPSLSPSPSPPFTLPDQHGTPRTLADLLTHYPTPPTPLASLASLTLLVFYPFAFSNICGGELQALQAALPDLETRGITLAAISCDPMFSLRVYAEREAFTFPLLSDFWPHGAVARDYGVFDEAKGCARRGSFLVDRDGIVRWSIVNPISEARPLSAYLEAADHLNR